VNGAVYDPSRVDFKPVLGTTEDWNVTLTLAAHIFHIHVNPLQITDVKDTKGISIWSADGHCTEMELKDRNGNPAPDPQYCDLKGVFRDSTIVSPASPATYGTGSPPENTSDLADFQSRHGDAPRLAGRTRKLHAGIMGSDFEKAMIAGTPLGRIRQPDDIARVAVFLASDDSAWLTGERLTASGGYR
jgi:hypothetical protein